MNHITAESAAVDYSRVMALPYLCSASDKSEGNVRSELANDIVRKHSPNPIFRDPYALPEPSQSRSKDSVVVLIVATTPWPLSARLALRLLAHKCIVHALCPRGDALTTLSGMGRVWRYSGLDSLAALQKAIIGSNPDIIVPCDDRAVWQLHEIHALRADLRGLIETSIGPATSFSLIRSRAGLIAAASGAGIRVPETRTVGSEDDLRSWFAHRPGMAVLKLDGTWGGKGVQVVGSETQAIETWQRLTSSETPGTAIKRWIIDRDPLAFWPRQSHQDRTVSIQSFVPGRPANAMVAAQRGEVLGLVAVEVLCSQGPTGASTIVRLIRNSQIERFARTLIGHLGLSGFHGLDFILEQSSGEPYLIELNARCTQLGHLVLPRQGDLAGLLCAAMGAPGPALLELPIDRDVVAFFPQALAWNPDSPYMQQCHHDIPWTEPALVRELVRDPWPERQWLSRIYNRVRGGKRKPLPNVANFLRLAAREGQPASSAMRVSVGRVTDSN